MKLKLYVIIRKGKNLKHFKDKKFKKNIVF